MIAFFNDGSGGSDGGAEAGVVTDTLSADLLATSSTDATVSVGGNYIGDLEAVGDSDWIAINLVAGQTYTISLSGYGDTPVSDTYLRLFAPGSQDRATGTLVPMTTMAAPATIHRLLTPRPPPAPTISMPLPMPMPSRAAISSRSADMWRPTTPGLDNPADCRPTHHGLLGGYQRSFNVGADNAITYNLSALDATYAGFARQALQTWSDIIGIPVRRDHRLRRDHLHPERLDGSLVLVQPLRHHDHRLDRQHRLPTG